MHKILFWQDTHQFFLFIFQAVNIFFTLLTWGLLATFTNSEISNEISGGGGGDFHFVDDPPPPIGDHHHSSTCARPLGLTSRSIEDWQLSASSSRPRSEDPLCGVRHARLHRRGGRAWCAARRARGEWISVDLGVESTVSGVVTQGREDKAEWVTSFLLSYSLDSTRWEFARDIYGSKKVFRGNSDAYSLRHSYLEHPVRARFVRIHVAGWHNHPAMRMEIIGCQGE